MKRFGTFGAFALLALDLSAQSPDKKLLSNNGELNAADLRALAAFDSLGTWCDISGASMDTTLVLSDPLWMSVLWLGDLDGVCEYVFLMTYDPLHRHVHAVKEIRTECDVDESAADIRYYEHHVMGPYVVKVAEEKPDRSGASGEWMGQVVPVTVTTFTVQHDGTIADSGPRQVIAESGQ